jgi:uncharacterized membrane protein
VEVFLFLIAAIPFILPIVNLVRMSGVKTRLRAVEELVEQQQTTIDELTTRLRDVRKETQAAAAPPPPVKAAAAPTTPAAPVPSAGPPLSHPAPPPPSSSPIIAPPSPSSSPIPAAESPSMPTPVPMPAPGTRPPTPAGPAAAPEPKPSPPIVSSPPIVPPPPTPPSPPIALPRIDWEQFIGVKMFSAVAGVALVLAAVFFLRYSIDQGWLVPPIRVAIGLLTGIGLLVVCDLKAARKYPVTANALDAAAIAILFATFFAAHALWNLVPASATFGLLALVTAVAVLLSIRRDSLFIAVLGLLGGFATPVLLSTGENRPIPLFAYVLLLNLGLAWVASRKRWTMLTVLTLVFTTLYQWGWVFRFLDASQLSLAMGIFLVFAVIGFTGLVFSARGSDASGGVRLVDRTAIAAAVMPLAFAAYLAAVPEYGARPALLFGFLLIVDAGLLAVSIGRGDEIAHAAGSGAAVLVFAVWLAASYSHAGWSTAVAFASAFVVFFALAPIVATRFRRPLAGMAARAIVAAPALLFVFPVIARIEPAVDAPFALFAALFALLLLIAWQAFARRQFSLYFIAAFFGMAAEASWSATHLTIDHLRAGLALYAAFGAYYIGVPVIARRMGRDMQPRWGGGVVIIAGLLLLLFLAGGSLPAESLWGLAVLLAIMNAGIFVESAAGELPAIAVAAGVVSWLVLAVWWANAADAVGVLPSLLFLVVLTLTMLGGHAWAYRYARSASDFDASKFGFRQGTYLGLLGHLFLFYTAIDPKWSTPPWPLFGALAVLTLALTASSLAVYSGELHAAGVIAASIIVLGWAGVSSTDWAPTMVIAAEVVVAHALLWVAVMRRRGSWLGAAIGAIWALFMANLTLAEASGTATIVPVAILVVISMVNIALIFMVVWAGQWDWVAPAAVIAAWWVQTAWHDHHIEPSAWASSFVFAAALYLVFVAYPFVLGTRARGSRDPYLAAIVGSGWFFFAARSALLQGGFGSVVGAVPVVEGLVMAALLRQLIGMEPAGARDLGRLALVAATALGFATVAIPLQLDRQWITIGWALEGAALAWTYRRIPHRGLLYWSAALLTAVFARLAMNPSVFFYEPRGYRVFNWYLYAYAICAASMFVAAWWFSKTEDRLFASIPRASALLPAAGVILLFILLNIEIADFYATGPEITFRFGVTIAQDLTYTIGWLFFGLLLLAAGISLHSRPARITAVALIAVTAFKAFLYDMGSLGGLYRVGSLVGLAVSLSLVALALQKFVLQPSRDQAS